MVLCWLAVFSVASSLSKVLPRFFGACFLFVGSSSGCAFGCLIILPALNCFVHDVSGTLCTRHVASGCLIEYAGVLSIPSISRVYNVVLQLFGQFKVSNKPITLHGMLRSTLAYCFTF